MKTISVHKFADLTVKHNKELKKDELVDALKAALSRKEAGARCICCGNAIWAAGSAITGSDMCFPCSTGEADDSDDYEVV